MVFAYARVSAVVGLKVEDYFPLKKRCWLRLHEKNGKVNEMPCHHKLEEYLDAYLKAAGVEGDRKGPLFRAAVGKTRGAARETLAQFGSGCVRATERRCARRARQAARKRVD